MLSNTFKSINIQMNINADYSQKVVINHHDLSWVASPEPGIERRMLDRLGDELAKATSISLDLNFRLILMNLVRRSWFWRVYLVMKLVTIQLAHTSWIHQDHHMRHLVSLAALFSWNSDTSVQIKSSERLLIQQRRLGIREWCQAFMSCRWCSKEVDLL